MAGGRREGEKVVEGIAFMLQGARSRRERAGEGRWEGRRRPAGSARQEGKA